MYRQRSGRARLTLASTGAALASCAALATIGSGVATAAVNRSSTHLTTSGRAKITEISWGEADNQNVNLYTLRGAGGMEVKVSQYGADIQSIDVPNKDGKLVDVALGFPSLADYVADFTQGATQTPWPISGGAGDVFFGATIGEYANRIAGGRFPLNGTTYQIDTNNGPNALHGGYLGWNTAVWAAAPKATPSTASITMSADFPAGTGCITSLTPGCTGFPTPIDATVTFSVTRQNELKIAYSAANESTTLATVVNLTNHTYYNLAGQASGNVYGQDLAINANQYQPTNSTQIPEPPYFLGVKGTPFDFLAMHTIGKYLTDGTMTDGTTGPIRQLQYAHGYDHNWVLNDQGKYRLDAVAQDPENGITLWQYTDQPGVQVYTSNYLVGDLLGTTGKAYRQGQAFTLETQHYPDAPNHQGDPAWPTVVLDAGQTFTSRTAMRFGIRPAGYAKTVQFK